MADQALTDQIIAAAIVGCLLFVSPPKPVAKAQPQAPAAAKIVVKK